MKFKTITNNPIAHESRDHQTPHGTAHDNSINKNFNNKLYMLKQQPISVSDWGCSGGGFVKMCLDDGHIAVGLEGSDYSLKIKRAEWANIPDNLFVCDITKPFKIVNESEPNNCFKFDFITMWEVAEHIAENDWSTLIDNALNHMKDDSLWIMSVSTQHGYHHVTVHDKEWWIDMFRQKGLENNRKLVEYFNRDWIRGPYAGQNAPESFHLILEKK